MYNKVIYVLFLENNQISLEQERDEKFDVLCTYTVHVQYICVHVSVLCNISCQNAVGICTCLALYIFPDIFHINTPTMDPPLK